MSVTTARPCFAKKKKKRKKVAFAGRIELQQNSGRTNDSAEFHSKHITLRNHRWLIRAFGCFKHSFLHQRKPASFQLLRIAGWEAASGEVKRVLLSPKGHGPRIAATSS